MYQQKLILCKAKLNDDGTQCVLDVPFQVFHQEVCCEGVNYRCYPLPKALDGKEVLALVTYSIEEKKVYDPVNKVDVTTVPDSRLDVAAISASHVTDFQKDVRVDKHWAVTKEDALATTDELGTVTKYAGTDKDERVGFCVSACFNKVIEEVATPK